MNSLREQLAGKTEDQAAGLLSCYATAPGTPGIRFVIPKRAIAFPYSHYLFSELTEEHLLAIRFATHRVILTGERLDVLHEELAGQRLAWVRLWPKRLREQAGPVWIERVEVVEARSAEAGPRTPTIRP